jgi:hypothetical protein
MERLGQSRNQIKRRIWRENLFIATRWAEWERMRGSGCDNYLDRVADMRRHGLPMTVAAFKKRVAKLKLARMSRD